MNEFLIGILTGTAILMVAYSTSTLHRLDKEIAQLTALLKILLVEQGKIRQITQTTLGAAETFVDALRDSANSMMQPPQNMRNMPPETFEDLRQSFENGIRGFEEENENEEGETPPDDVWKK